MTLMTDGVEADQKIADRGRHAYDLSASPIVPECAGSRGSDKHIAGIDEEEEVDVELAGEGLRAT